MTLKEYEKQAKEMTRTVKNLALLNSGIYKRIPCKIKF